jgi:hypothetical protein
MIKDTVKLEDNEEIILIVRRHWFSLAIEAFTDLFIFLMTVLAVVAFDSVFLKHVEIGAVSLSSFFLSFVALLLWMRFFGAWSDHWLDAWIVTNRRIIDIEQHGFFHREVSSFSLNRIQDITYTVSGIIPTWLHFGDVRIQTASISDDFIMRQIPFPEDVKEGIVRIVDEFKYGEKSNAT